MRVESDRPLRNGGYLHKLTDAPVRYDVPKPAKPVTIDAVKIWRDLNAATKEGDLSRLAFLLGVTLQSLKLIGTVWIASKHAWGFPMRRADGRTIGLRIRNEAADKWSWPGSKAGIFTTGGHDAKQPLYVVEGPTSLAAMDTMQFSAIGRPSCAGQEDIVNEYIKLNRVREVILVADDDPHESGMKGMEKLQETLKVRSVIITCCGFKDAREGLKAGVTKQVLESIVASQIWHQPCSKERIER